jgi:hypothetical protein
MAATRRGAMKRSEMIDIIADFFIHGLPQDEQYLWKHARVYADSLLVDIEEYGMLPPPKEIYEKLDDTYCYLSDCKWEPESDGRTEGTDDE